MFKKYYLFTNNYDAQKLQSKNLRKFCAGQITSYFGLPALLLEPQGSMKGVSLQLVVGVVAECMPLKME